MNQLYGDCPHCGGKLQAEWFVEEECRYVNGHSYKTGRVRDAVAYIYCPNCLRNFPVDDSFDGPWREGR